MNINKTLAICFQIYHGGMVNITPFSIVVRSGTEAGTKATRCVGGGLWD